MVRGGTSNILNLVDIGNNLFEVQYSTQTSIAGFQFDIIGATILSVSNGDAQKQNFDISHSKNKILGEIVGGTFSRPERIPPVRDRSPGDGAWSPSGADLSPGGGYGQSPTGSDIAGTPFSRGGILGAF